MNINKKDLDRHFWYEDINGNIIDKESVRNMDSVTYHSLFPLEITEHIDEYCWHPKTKLHKFLCKFKPAREYLRKKYRTKKTFKHICDCNCHIGGGNQEVILAMVNSGDYTLAQALRLYSQSCERCMNVLAYKYLDGKDGSVEYSDEWKKANTVCDFCREDD